MQGSPFLFSYTLNVFSVFDVFFCCLKDATRITPQSFLFPDDCHDQSPSTPVVSIFAEVDALPRPHVQTAIGDGNRQADSAECRLGMSRHVVGTFQRVLVLRSVLGNQPVENGLHVHAHIRVAVLVDAESATRMLREDIDDASLRELRQLSQNFIRHQVESPRSGL